jgi:MFS family permease
MKDIYNEYPRIFWNLVVITFIDRIGGALLFPFFALYITSKFDVGMTAVGGLFAAFAVSSFGGSAIGGAVTDRFGRKGVIIFGLVASSMSALAMGFAMYGFVSFYYMFIVAMVIITIGEMIVSPVAQALVASFAPEDMRGRYMAVSGFSWGIPFAVGPYFAGLIIDGPTPHFLWYVAGFIGLLSTIGFLGLQRVRNRDAVAVAALQETHKIILEVLNASRTYSLPRLQF